MYVCQEDVVQPEARTVALASFSAFAAAAADAEAEPSAAAICADGTPRYLSIYPSIYLSICTHCGPGLILCLCRRGRCC